MLEIVEEGLTADPTARRAKTFAVLKVAMSDQRGEVPVREAEVMGRLRPDSRIIRLVEPEPLQIGGRTVLVIEYVGDERDDDAIAESTGHVGRRSRRRQETVARQLRDSGRLTLDQPEAYGDYLFGAVDFLEGEGVWHLLIDFSLADCPVQQVQAGAEGYLDPFIGTLTSRSVYDAHAERYAIAVTLHEMASSELQVWGGGGCPPGRPTRRNSRIRRSLPRRSTPPRGTGWSRFLAALRCKAPTGLKKRANWEHVWDLQRQEDAASDVPAKRMV